MRYLSKYIEKDLDKKMVFITGPRQCGKTTLANEILQKSRGLYLNWDDPDHRKIILQRDWSDEDEIIAFDEIHKYSRWKNFIKGTFDTQKNKHQFIITGSSHLDTYEKGQDSMLGRFFSWRLHPLCLSELKNHFGNDDKNNLNKMLTLGGFPEPFLEGDEVYAKRWRNEKNRLVFRQDILELEDIRDISLLEMFHEVLTTRVGGEIVLSNIARDLEIAPKTAKSWLNILEKTYSVFAVRPYSQNILKSITKIPKIYFYDNGEVQNDIGARFENLVANHLLKKINFLEDMSGDRYELHYLRNQSGHEIDFLVVKNKKPILLIEAKVSDKNRSPAFYYYKERLKVNRCIQLVMNLDKASTKDDILVTPAFDWLSKPLEEEF